MRVIQDVWHGDSREKCEIFKHKQNVRSVITDPPFGVDNQSNMAVTAEGKKHARKIANDESPEIAMGVFTDVMRTLMWGMHDESDIYVFTAHQVLEEWLFFTRELFEPQGFKRKAILVWEKDGPGMGDLNSWGMGCEFILYYKRGGYRGTDARRNNILHVPQLRPGNLTHPHEKPTDLLAPLIKHSTHPGDLIVDPFGGSGSLARACRETGRSGISIEYDEHNYTRAKAKLDASSTGLF